MSAAETKRGLDDAFADGLTSLDLEVWTVDTLPDAGPTWEPPIPLDMPSGPELPPDAFPEPVQGIVNAIAEATQTPRGLAAALGLAVLSAAARGRYEVFLPEHGHAEPLVLHTAAVMAPAERKTAVYLALVASLNDVAQERRLEEEKPVREWISKREVLVKRLAAAEKAEAEGPTAGTDKKPGVTAKTLEDRRKAALVELLEHDRHAVYLTTLLADDITNQRLKELMVQNRGAAAVVSDEGTFLEVMGGRHSDGAPQLETILNGHTGGKVDMQRRSGPPMYWPRGYLTIGLAIQPHVIHAWGAAEGVIGRGAAARLMAVFPPSKVGQRNNDAPPVPDALTVAWDRLVRRILDLEPAQATDTGGFPLPFRLTLASEAYRLYRPHWDRIEAGLNPGGAYADFPDWAGKLHGATLRIAGLLHLATDPEPHTYRISAETMWRAITLALWLAEHARIMYRVMASPKGQEAARHVLDTIRTLAAEESPVPRWRLHRALRGRETFKRADALNEPLDLLEEYGWIHRVKERTAGRPQEFIILNPCETMEITPIRPVERADSPLFGVITMDFRELRKRETIPGASGNDPGTVAGDLPPTGTDGAYTGEDVEW